MEKTPAPQHLKEYIFGTFNEVLNPRPLSQFPEGQEEFYYKYLLLNKANREFINNCVEAMISEQFYDKLALFQNIHPDEFFFYKTKSRDNAEKITLASEIPDAIEYHAIIHRTFSYGTFSGKKHGDDYFTIIFESKVKSIVRQLWEVASFYFESFRPEIRKYL